MTYSISTNLTMQQLLVSIIYFQIFIA